MDSSLSHNTEILSSGKLYFLARLRLKLEYKIVGKFHPVSLRHATIESSRQDIRLRMVSRICEERFLEVQNFTRRRIEEPDFTLSNIVPVEIIVQCRLQYPSRDLLDSRITQSDLEKITDTLYTLVNTGCPKIIWSKFLDILEIENVTFFKYTYVYTCVWKYTVSVISRCVYKVR